MLPQILHVLLLSAAISSALAHSSTVPTLTAVRDALALLEDDILHSLLSRSTLPPSTQRAEAQSLRRIFKTIYDADTDSTVPSSAFDPHPAGTSLPYLQYDRGDGHQWGDTSSSATHSLLDFYYTTLVPDLTARFHGPKSNTSTIRPTPHLGALSSASLLATLSSRIGLGTQVAAAKFAANTSAYCAPIRARDLRTVRKMLTDPVQEKAVQERVRSKADAWGRTPILDGTEPPRLNASAPIAFDPMVVVQLFRSYLITLTSDVEVAQLMNYHSLC